jgi:hypothetical protein
MGPLQSTEEYLNKWRDIIDAVDKINIPINFVNSISFNIDPGAKSSLKETIDIQFLRDEGFDNHSIQGIISNKLLNLPNLVEEMEFELDIIGIAIKAQSITDTLLKNII